MITEAEHSKSANRNKYKILSPFEATINAITDMIIKIFLDNLKLSPL